MPANHLILCCPLLLLSSIFPSIVVFFHELTLRIRWPKYWSISFSISPSNEYSGLISFRIDYWFDLLVVQWTLKNLLQYHNSKASILWHVFFTVRLSLLYMTTGKILALTIWTFVGKVMSLLFNMLSRFVIAFLPRSKHLLISWLQSPSAVVWEPKKRKYVTASTFPPFICHEVLRFMGSKRVGHDWATELNWTELNGTGCHDLSFLNVEFQASFFTLLFHPHQEAL